MSDEADLWTELWLRSQRFPLLHGAAIHAHRRHASPAPLVALGRLPDPVVGVVLEQRRPGVLTPLCQPDPLLVDRSHADVESLLAVLEQAMQVRGVTALHFPLVDRGSPSADLLASVPGILSWPRTPSPVVGWSERGNDLWPRVCARHGSQAERKRRRFEGTLAVAHLQRDQADRAVHSIEHIEQRSWKQTVGLNLLPGQVEYFHALLVHDQASVTVAMLDDAPVAYRLDAVHDDTVYTVRWSYDDAHRRFAPGFYLMTRALAERWGPVPLRRIHLMGHPDTLKALIEDDTQPRLDFAWPDGDQAGRLRDEAVAYDRRRADQYSSGRGLRHFFS